MPTQVTRIQVTWSEFIRYTKENVLREFQPEYPKAGVYLLWVLLSDRTSWKALYVGKAADLRDRLLYHLSQNEENECIRWNVERFQIAFQYALVSKESDRAGVEKFLYDTYHPECNQNDPGGTPIAVNLPA